MRILIRFIIGLSCSLALAMAILSIGLHALGVDALLSKFASFRAFYQQCTTWLPEALFQNPSYLQSFGIWFVTFCILAMIYHVCDTFARKNEMARREMDLLETTHEAWLADNASALQKTIGAGGVDIVDIFEQDTNTPSVRQFTEKLSMLSEKLRPYHEATVGIANLQDEATQFEEAVKKLAELEKTIEPLLTAHANTQSIVERAQNLHARAHRLGTLTKIKLPGETEEEDVSNVLDSVEDVLFSVGDADDIAEHVSKIAELNTKCDEIETSIKDPEALRSSVEALQRKITAFAFVAHPFGPDENHIEDLLNRYESEIDDLGIEDIDEHIAKMRELNEQCYRIENEIGDPEALRSSFKGLKARIDDLDTKVNGVYWPLGESEDGLEDQLYALENELDDIGSIDDLSDHVAKIKELRTQLHEIVDGIRSATADL